MIQNLSISTTSRSTSTCTSISESSRQPREDSQYSHVNPMIFPRINNARSLPVPNRDRFPAQNNIVNTRVEQIRNSQKTYEYWINRLLVEITQFNQDKSNFYLENVEIEVLVSMRMCVDSIAHLGKEIPVYLLPHVERINIVYNSLIMGN